VDEAKMGGDSVCAESLSVGGTVGAALYTFEVQGTVEFTVDVVGGPVDLTGYVGSMMIRELRVDPVPLVTVDPSNITVNSGTRQVTVRIPSSVSETFDWERGVYDVYVTGPGGDAWRIVEGRVTNSQAVTRS
jgi:hypothetical protein